MGKRKSKSKKAIKDLYLDRPTSHGGWPKGHTGSYRDPHTPVNKQIAKYLEDMGMLEDSNPRARLSESKLRSMIRASIRRLLKWCKILVKDLTVLN